MTTPAGDLALTAADLRRRFLLLRATRWLPTGLLIPVVILVMLDRGLSLGQIGLVTAGQGIMVMLLELPTGGLADTLGRRRVLAVAAGVELCALGLLVVADTVWLLLGVWLLQGVYRALESGPLDAWYVDAAQAADPDADLERGLAQAGTVLGLAIAAGAVLASVLVGLAPLPGVDPLVAPILAALALRVVDLGAILRLMVEPPSDAGRRAGVGGVTDSVRAVPGVIRAAADAVRASTALKALFGVELLWGMGMVAFEAFTPARLEVVLGDTEQAAVLFGPTSAVSWAAAAGGAALVPLVTRRLAPRHAGPVLLGLLAVGVVGIALTPTAGLVVASFVVTMTMHGAANPVHQGLLHRAVTTPGNRATLVSVNSLVASLGGTVGGITLGALADATTLATATLAGAALVAAAGPLYLLARPAGTSGRAVADASTPPAAGPGASVGVRRVRRRRRRRRPSRSRSWPGGRRGPRRGRSRSARPACRRRRGAGPRRTGSGRRG